MFYEYNKLVNRPVKVGGVPMKELFFVVVGFAGLILLAAIVKTLFDWSHWSYYLVCIVLLIVSVIILKKANKHDHPSFLLSFISYRFIQPKKIKLNGTRFPADKRPKKG